MNQLTIRGNLTRDPECRLVQTRKGQMACTSYTVAVNRPRRDGQDQGADFFRVTTWGKAAENDNQYLRKGSSVLVVGSIKLNTYTKQDGTQGAGMDVAAREVEYLSRAGDAGQTAAPAPVIDQASGMEVVEQQELPF